MDTGSADILSACGLEARVPIKPWLELSFISSTLSTGKNIKNSLAAPVIASAARQSRMAATKSKVLDCRAALAMTAHLFCVTEPGG